MLPSLPPFVEFSDPLELKIDRTLVSPCSLFIRLAASFVSWGIAFASPFVGGNIYVNVVITSCSGLLAYPASGLLTLR